MKKRYALYIGRWQPLHNGHCHIIQEALDRGENVLIAVRCTPRGVKDPLTYRQRKRIIKRVFRGFPVKVMKIPDIVSINIGRKVGYEVLRYDPPESVGAISGTDIRDQLKSGSHQWRDKVPSASARLIRRFLGRKP